MGKYHDSLFMKTLRHEPVSRRPVWLMRQAGRYLPEYRQLRQKAGGFLKMVKNPELACEITLQPINRFYFDAAIIFSDILIIPDAMNLGLNFVEGEGPRLSTPLRDATTIDQLAPMQPETLQYLFDSCRLTRQNLADDIPLVGFCGSPFTLATYMIDGQGGDFCHARQMLYARPDLFHRVLQHVTQAVIDTLIGQINAGCQAVMIFDSWGGLLTDIDYPTFSLRYIRRIINHIKQESDTPVIVFGRQCALSLSAIADCQPAAVGVDWQTGLATARRLVNNRVALQGNIDPFVLLTNPQTVKKQTLGALSSYDDCDNKRGLGHILNLGHGIDKKTPIDNVNALIEAVHSYKISI